MIFRSFGLDTGPELLIQSSRPGRTGATEGVPMDLSTLRAGDRIRIQDRHVDFVPGMARTRERIVVRVVDLDGARGGLVDTRPVDGRYSPTSGFEFGDEIVEVIR